MSNNEKLGYKLFTGEDTRDFCVRISDALKDGYVLYGSPAATFDPTTNRMLVAQAVILPGNDKAG